MPKNKPASQEIFAAVHVQISGRVQGVGFRYFAQLEAQRYGLKGWVRNAPNGLVEAEAEGEKEAINKWLTALKKGPSMARVEACNVQWSACNHRFTYFEVSD